MPLRPGFHRLLGVLAGILLLGGAGCLRRQPVTQEVLAPRPVWSNRALLSASPYPRLLVEVDYQKEDPPSPYALAALRRWLARYADKPEGIEVRLGDAIPKEAFGETRSDFVRTAREHAGGPPDDETYYVYVLYAPKYEKYRGIAWRAGGLSGELPFPVVGMLNRQLRRDSFLWLTRRKVEAAVLIHEFGHVAGLVTARDHTDGTQHCTDPACRMYRRVDARSLAATLIPVLCRGVLPTDFCSLCQRDLDRGQFPEPIEPKPPHPEGADPERPTRP